MTSHLAQFAGAGALLYAARRYYRDWGTTKEECRMPMAGDDLIAGPVTRTTEAIWIDAPVAAVWPWLIQIGQDRGGLYSYEAMENVFGLDYHNADRIHPEWQQLAVGDVVRLAPRGWMGLRDGIALEVVQVVDHESIVLCTPALAEWECVCSFHVIPHWNDRCRLVIRTRIRLNRPGRVFLTELLGPPRALLVRGILVGIKRRVLQHVQAEASATKASGDLHHIV